jgi:hypothetical protein
LALSLTKAKALIYGIYCTYFTGQREITIWFKASTVIGEKHQLKLALSSGSVHEHVELT